MNDKQKIALLRSSLSGLLSALDANWFGGADNHVDVAQWSFSGKLALELTSPPEETALAQLVTQHDSIDMREINCQNPNR